MHAPNLRAVMHSGSTASTMVTIGEVKDVAIIGKFTLLLYFERA